MTEEKVKELRVLLFKAWGLAYELEQHFKTTGDPESTIIFDDVGMKLNSLECIVMEYNKQLES